MSISRRANTSASLFREIVADDADEIHVREMAGSDGKISRRAAEGAIHFAARRFDRVVRYRSNNE